MTSLQAWQYNFENQELIRVNLLDDVSSLDSLAITLPDGVYTTLRIYEYNKLFQFDAHFRRLEESLRLSEYKLGINKQPFRLILEKIVNQYEFKDIKLRLHLPFNNLKTCIILLEKIIPYPEFVHKVGVKVKTNQLLRSNPKAKLTSFIQLAFEEKRSLKDLGLEESIITNKNTELLEGLTSNFFAIRNNVILTADKNILHGVTRQLVLEEAEKNGINVILAPIHLEELLNISEAFITSTSRGVMPVVQIDNKKIGNGLPGVITSDIAKFLNNRINNELETI